MLPPKPVRTALVLFALLPSDICIWESQTPDCVVQRETGVDEMIDVADGGI